MIAKRDSLESFSALTESVASETVTYKMLIKMFLIKLFLIKLLLINWVFYHFSNCAHNQSVDSRPSLLLMKLLLIKCLYLFFSLSAIFNTVDYKLLLTKLLLINWIIFSISAIFNTWLQRGTAWNHSVDSRPRHTRPGLLSMLHPSLSGMENSCCRLLWSVKRKKEKE